jgi:hypothetical protein
MTHTIDYTQTEAPLEVDVLSATVDTSEISDTAGAASTHQIPGWTRPRWATERRLEECGVSWHRHPSGEIPAYEVVDPTRELTYPLAIEIVRFDDILIDDDAGSLALRVGRTVVCVGDDCEIPIGRGRAFVAALTEVLDAYDAAQVTA